jgi:sigma-B regulation protein RsbU (phosphoserine phosphatase)
LTARKETNLMDIATLVLDIFEKLCVVVAVTLLLTRTRLFSGVMRHEATLLSRLILVLVFGAFAIYGTYSGIALPSGAIANIRDVFPMMAGLIGGPVAGLGAGLIGGAHRYFFIGGATALPCAIATTAAGLLSGLIFHWRRQPHLSPWLTLLFAALVEAAHMGLILLLVPPFATAAGIVQAIAPYMITGNALGLLIFTLMFNARLHEG